MKKLKELFSDTLLYGISSVLARFINYLLVPLHTNVFSRDQYGVVGLVYAAIALLNVVFTFGMESAYLRYAKDREKARDVFKTLQLSLLAFASVLTAALWLGEPLLRPLMGLDAANADIYLFMLGILWFDALGIVPFAELRLVRRTVTYVALRTVNVLINLGLNVYLILSLGWGLPAVFLANLAASVLTTLALWVITGPMLRGDWQRGLLRQALYFGFPFVPAGIGFTMNEMLDRYLLEHYMSPATTEMLYGTGMDSTDVVGIYNACYKLAVFMLLVIQMFRMAWQPFFLRHADDPEAPKLYSEAFRYFNLAAGAVFLAVALFAEQIVQIRIPVLDMYLVDAKFWSGLHVVPLLLGAYWFHGWYMNFSAGIFIREKTRVLGYITLGGAAITLAANLLLIPWMGMTGSAAATLLSYAAMALMLYYKSMQVYEVPYAMKRAVLTMAVAACCVLYAPDLVQLVNSEWMGRFIMLGLGGAGIAAAGLWGRGFSLESRSD
ncbi:MAG: polysaccharide biosynthesis C-terminal domain-containing protein [Balneolaceae bacterium]|nr:polysaccharide biosynthesis C-terminal domain-containing protein [Balneolaceae bacterium]